MNAVQEFFIQRTCWDDDKEESLRLIKEKEQHRAFPNEVWEMLTVNSTDFNGKKVLVPSSGDNFAVFAFSLLGAIVTSADFTQKVLDEAEMRANEHGLSNIIFKNVDTMTLDKLPDNEYDFVFTSNGVYNCLHNIQEAHNNFFRVLKPNGIFCFYENHPFYGCMSEKTKINGFQCRGTGVLSFKNESYKTVNEPVCTYNFHTIEDYINSLSSAGFTITNYCDIKRRKDAIPIFTNRSNIKFIVQPMLPSWIGISAVKKQSE